MSLSIGGGHAIVGRPRRKVKRVVALRLCRDGLMHAWRDSVGFDSWSFPGFQEKKDRYSDFPNPDGASKTALGAFPTYAAHPKVGK